MQIPGTGYHHAYQYQTPQQFQAQMKKVPGESEEARSVNRFEEIMKQLANPFAVGGGGDASGGAEKVSGGGGGWQAGWVGNAAQALKGVEGARTPAANVSGAKVVGTPTERPEWSPISEVATPVRK